GRGRRRSTAGARAARRPRLPQALARRGGGGTRAPRLRGLRAHARAARRLSTRRTAFGRRRGGSFVAVFVFKFGSFSFKFRSFVFGFKRGDRFRFAGRRRTDGSPSPVARRRDRVAA